MELNGALSNPQLVLEIQRITEVRCDLAESGIGRAVTGVRPRAGAVADAVRTVLSLADAPMRASDVYRACEELLGQPVRWGTVKSALASAAASRGSNIERVAYGKYTMRS